MADFRGPQKRSLCAVEVSFFAAHSGKTVVDFLKTKNGKIFLFLHFCPNFALKYLM
jgi:hypothetical protein